MPYTVLLLEDAVKDIEAIYRHYRRSGSAKIAKDILSSLRKACSSLSSHPERGHIPPGFQEPLTLNTGKSSKINSGSFTRLPNLMFLSLALSTVAEISVRS